LLQKNEPKKFHSLLAFLILELMVLFLQIGIEQIADKWLSVMLLYMRTQNIDRSISVYFVYNELSLHTGFSD